MTQNTQRQREYWNREVESFNAIYTGGKSAPLNFLDKVFRKDMYRRYDLTIDGCEPVAGRSILDVGCGSGVYALELARRGAELVLGVDIAEQMIDLCRKQADEQSLTNTEFVHGEIQDLPADRLYDVSFAIGLFDYMTDSVSTLSEMKKRTTKRMILAYPRLWTWRAPIRKVRLGLRNCEVHFYSREMVRRDLARAGLTDYEIVNVGKLFLVIAEL